MLGRFITIEGIDGAGKSTQTESLLKHLADQGVSVLHTREPGGTPLAEKIRAMLLADDMAPDAATLLFFAARADHVRRVIRPTLESGRWVLSDRFTDATYAYQVGGKGFPGEKVEALEKWTLGGFAPDLTLLFDIAPAVAAARLRARAGDQDHILVILLDDTVQVHVNEILARHGAPVANDLLLHVVTGQRTAQQGVIEQVQLACCQVVAGTPIGVDLFQFGRIQHNVPP